MLTRTLCLARLSLCVRREQAQSVKGATLESEEDRPQTEIIVKYLSTDWSGRGIMVLSLKVWSYTTSTITSSIIESKISWQLPRENIVGYIWGLGRMVQRGTRHVGVVIESYCSVANRGISTVKANLKTAFVRLVLTNTGHYKGEEKPLASLRFS